MGGFFPGEKDKFLMGENKMPRNQGKPCAGESQISAEETLLGRLFLYFCANNLRFLIDKSNLLRYRLQFGIISDFSHKTLAISAPPSDIYTWQELK